jgi:hypothetical protein
MGISAGGQMKTTHIFMDNSNIFGGAQRTAQEREQAIWLSVRVDYEHLFRLLVYGKQNRRTSMLAGSVPPGNEALWEAAKHAGFDTTLLRRVENDTGRLVEQGVDEAIHLKIANVLLDADESGTMVLATGDGAETDQGSSFTQQVRRAAKRGWNVEIWSWQVQLAKRLRDTRLEFQDQVKVFKLDGWYDSIVFIKGGTYFVDGAAQTVITRSCKPFNLTDTKIAEAIS